VLPLEGFDSPQPPQNSGRFVHDDDASRESDTCL
jgi:hypothetical protein